ncbi:hypothetical protein [Alloactinosynnema sp. L-07]|uniref:hypothetical protein n=1 Tax=Alloactinosynnema sp. L-07 TaxID=1653480 RepID=UPI00065EFD09|nr:hypothetical protein [Alloactinosynnema sp. L-07]CRK54991.1 hypothetical protein [Alloactinosynnema sp. L-07]
MKSSDAVVAGAVAACLSGVPSTAWALLTRADPLEATLAAGSILLPRETRRGRLLVSAAVTHIGLSLGWAQVIARLPPRKTVGALAGLAIAAVDLGLVGRRFPRVRALPLGPQVADHVAYGVIVAVVLRSQSRKAVRQ